MVTLLLRNDDILACSKLQEQTNDHVEMIIPENLTIAAASEIEVMGRMSLSVFGW